MDLQTYNALVAGIRASRPKPKGTGDDLDDVAYNLHDCGVDGY